MRYTNLFLVALPPRRVDASRPRCRRRLAGAGATGDEKEIQGARLKGFAKEVERQDVLRSRNRQGGHTRTAVRPDRRPRRVEEELRWTRCRPR